MGQEEPWSMRQWAMDHDRSDNFRFSIIWRIFGAAGTVIIALLAWSLKTQYDTQASTIAELQQTRVQVEATGNAIVQHMEHGRGQSEVGSPP